MCVVLNKRTGTCSPNSVYIGRPTKWGNPYTIGIDGTREQVIEKYKRYIASRADLQVAAKQELRGKDLVCWCYPEACHGDILIQIANKD